MKTRFIGISLVFVLSGFLPTASGWAGNDTALNAEKNERLKLHLGRIEREARSERYWGGGTLLASGVALGVAAIVTNRSSHPETRRHDPTVLGLSAGVVGVLGALVLALPTDSEKLPKEFASVPENTPEERSRKVLTGETYLSQLDARAHKQRMIGGGVLTALGVSEMIGYMAANKSDRTTTILVQGALLTGLGLVNLFTEQVEELEQKSYLDWKSQQRVGRAEWNLAPIKGGALVQLGWRFW